MISYDQTGDKMDGQLFVHNLADLLQNCVLSFPIKSEIDLERQIRPIIRNYVKESLHVSDEKLADVVFSHGETKTEKNIGRSQRNTRMLLSMDVPIPVMYSLCILILALFILK